MSDIVLRPKPGMELAVEATKKDSQADAPGKPIEAAFVNNAAQSIPFANRCASDDVSLIFVHPPRTAGSTLSRILHREYNAFQICDVDPRFYYWSLQRLSRWPEHRLRKVKLFNGHMPFGIHQFVPQPSTYITVLRDPIERTISEYNVRRHRRMHPIADRDARRLSLEEFVMKVPYNNPQTKAIAGVDTPYNYHFYSIRPSHHFYSGPCTVETLELAKKNLLHYFRLVGLTERFEETLALGKVLFGWKIDSYTLARPGPPGMERTVPPRLRALIAEYNKFDMDLYSFGVSLFNRAIQEHGNLVTRELDAIRRARRLTRTADTYYRCGSIIRRHFIRLCCAL